MNILVIDGHPYQQSFCQALADQYTAGAREQGHQVELLSLRDLKFELSLKSGYSLIQELETDLVNAQSALKKADHIVIVTPIWWGGPPALLKGFMDRTFLPGFAFKYRKGSKLWDKFMKGKTGRLIVTSDAPSWYMRFYRGDSTVRLIRESTLDFVGVWPIGVTRLGDIKWLKEPQRLKTLAKVRQLGARAK